MLRMFINRWTELLLLLVLFLIILIILDQRTIGWSSAVTNGVSIVIVVKLFLRYIAV